MGGERLAGPPKRASEAGAHLVLGDETGLFLDPVVRRASAAAGRTPVVDAGGGHRGKVSVTGGVSPPPTSHRLGFDFATAPGGFFTAGTVVEYLRGLLRHLRGNVIAAWDRGGNHAGPVIPAVRRRSRRLRPEILPAGAPGHNPVEAVWSWLRYGVLANFTPAGIGPLDGEVSDRLIGLKFDPDLPRALWDRSKLPPPKREQGQ